MMTAQEVIESARQNLGGAMESSARLRLVDAEALLAASKSAAARRAAEDSLRYSVGIAGPAYLAAVTP